MLQSTRREGGHVGERGVAEKHRIEPLGHRKRHRQGRRRARAAGAVVAPIGDRSIGIHQGELELPAALEVHAIDRDTALVVEELGHRCLGCDRTDDCEPNDQQRAEGVMGFENHGWGKGGRVVGKRPGAGADDGGAGLTGSAAPGRKPSPESDA